MLLQISFPKDNAGNIYSATEVYGMMDLTTILNVFQNSSQHFLVKLTLILQICPFQKSPPGISTHPRAKIKGEYLK